MNTNTIFRFTKIHPLLLLAIVVVFMMMLFWVATSILKLLSIISPALLVASLIINYRVALGYIQWVKELIVRNPLMGIISVVFTFIGFPVVSLFLFLRALSSKGYGSGARERAKFAPYEEVDDEDFLDLSELKKHRKDIDDKFKDVN